MKELKKNTIYLFLEEFNFSILNACLFLQILQIKIELLFVFYEKNHVFKCMKIFQICYANYDYYSESSYNYTLGF